MVVVGDAEERGMFDGCEWSDCPNDGFKISEIRKDFIFDDGLCRVGDDDGEDEAEDDLE